ncbi:hypothetical protein [Photorhabdus hindustanensis]|uniref:hypothetical protein n=1 Tax=Photorhabdus hindustanensis TaxID=2918802 RepID=UPI0020006549|nr:hypothetical protein [Photorhabdus hindustanensis]
MTNICQPIVNAAQKHPEHLALQVPHSLEHSSGLSFQAFFFSCLPFPASINPSRLRRWRSLVGDYSTRLSPLSIAYRHSGARARSSYA